jgi:hypothetical protein
MILRAAALLAALALIPVGHAADAPSAPAPTANADPLDVLDRQLVTEEMKAKVAEARKKRADAERNAGSPQEPSAFPTLSRIYGFAGAEVAVFDQAATTYEARPGDAVTADWLLDSVRSAGVVLRHKASGEKRLLMLGTRSLAPKGIGIAPVEPLRADAGPPPITPPVSPNAPAPASSAPK